MANLHKIRFGHILRRRVVPLFVIATFLMTSLPAVLYSQNSFFGPIVQEREPNNTIARAQPVPIPVVVKGRLEGIDPNFQFVAFNVAGLVDNFRVQTRVPGTIVADLSFSRGLVAGELDPDLIDAVGAILNNNLSFPIALFGPAGFQLFAASDPNLILLGLGPTRTIDRSNYGYLALPSTGFGGGDSIGRGNRLTGAVVPPLLPGPGLLPNLPNGFALGALLAANAQANSAEILPKQTRRSNAAGFKPPIGTLPPDNYVLAVWDGTTDFFDFFFTGAIITFATFFAPALGGRPFLRNVPDAGTRAVGQFSFFTGAEFDNIQSVRYTSEARSSYSLRIGFRARVNQPGRGAELAEFPAPAEPLALKENTTVSKLQHLNQIAAGNLGIAVRQKVGDAYKISLKESQPIQFDLVYDTGWTDTFQVYRKTPDRRYELVATASPQWGPEDVGMYLTTGRLVLPSGDYYVAVPCKPDDLFAVSATDGASINPIAVGLKLHPPFPPVGPETVQWLMDEISKAKAKGQKFTLRLE